MSHDAAARVVYGHRVRPRHQNSREFRSALDWTITLHPHNPIHNRELSGTSRMQVGDRFSNPRPVQNVLRPTVNRARHHAEKVLHRYRGAYPVMRLELRHEDQQIRSQDGIWKVPVLGIPENCLSRRTGSHRRIEIRETVFEFRHGPEIPGGIRQVERVAPVPRTLGD